jgi:hypothetical protein
MKTDLSPNNPAKKVKTNFSHANNEILMSGVEK